MSMSLQQQQQQQQQQAQSNNPVVRLVVISDTHNRHKALTPLLPPPPPHDSSIIRQILIHCGDFADRGSRYHIRSFCRWLSRNEFSEQVGLPSHYQDIVVIDGNHDHARPPHPAIDLAAEFETCNQVIRERGLHRRVHFLQDSSVDIDGVRIHGVSWKSIQKDDYVGDYSALWNSNINDGRQTPDVVMAHLIPYFGSAERRVAQSFDGSSIPFQAWEGSRQLTAVALEQNFKLVLSGHVHWGRGAVYIPSRTVTTTTTNNDGSTTKINNITTKNGTWFVNAATTKPGLHRLPQDTPEELQVTAPVVIDYDTARRCVVDLKCPSH